MDEPLGYMGEPCRGTPLYWNGKHYIATRYIAKGESLWFKYPGTASCRVNNELPEGVVMLAGPAAYDESLSAEERAKSVVIIKNMEPNHA